MEILVIDQLRPFVVLAGFILVLLVLEVVLMLVGLSSAIEFDAPDMGGADIGDAAFLGDTDLTADELAMLDVPPSPAAPDPPSAARRLVGALGLGQGPLLIWMVAMAAGVSVVGFFLQLTFSKIMGAMLPASLALALVALPGLWLGRQISAWIARLVPAFESHAISGQSYHGRRGIVVIGTAARGEAAQVRWQDMYGTVHSLMAEPLRDGDVIAAGTEVLIVKTRERAPRLVCLS
jgi:hypothetical protein